MNTNLPRQSNNSYAEDAERDIACGGRSPLKQLACIVGKTVAIMAVAMVVGWSAFSPTADHAASRAWGSAQYPHDLMRTNDMWNKLALGFH